MSNAGGTGRAASRRWRVQRKTLVQAFTVISALVAYGCVSEKSSNPLSPTVAGPIPGVNITTPRPLEPSAGAKVPVDQQPITLLVENAVTNGPRPLSYLFEVATDSGFANKVFVREGIAPGSGRTSLRLPDLLPTGRTYYWRSLAQDGANSSPYSGGVSFNVYTPIVIDRPQLVSPVNNAHVTSLQPTFTFANAPRSGPVGAVKYEVQVAATDSFASPFADWTVDEQAGQTSTQLPQAASNGQYLFWRVRAYEPTTTGPWSGVWAFVIEVSSGGGGGSNGHIPPGSPTVDRARLVVLGTGTEFPNLTKQGDSEAAASELMLRMIWHLQLAGFQAGRQRNPSGAISGDKLTVFADGAWHAYDVLSTRPPGTPLDVHFDEVFPPNYVPDPGIAD